MNQDLLPCPFCGGKAFVQYCNGGDIGYVVRCVNHCVQIPVPWKKPFNEIKEATIEWNKRKVVEVNKDE